MIFTGENSTVYFFVIAVAVIVLAAAVYGFRKDRNVERPVHEYKGKRKVRKAEAGFKKPDKAETAQYPAYERLMKAENVLIAGTDAADIDKVLANCITQVVRNKSPKELNLAFLHDMYEYPNADNCLFSFMKLPHVALYCGDAWKAYYVVKNIANHIMDEADYSPKCVVFLYLHGDMYVQMEEYIRCINKKGLSKGVRLVVALSDPRKKRMCAETIRSFDTVVAVRCKNKRQLRHILQTERPDERPDADTMMVRRPGGTTEKESIAGRSKEDCQKLVDFWCCQDISDEYLMRRYRSAGEIYSRCYLNEKPSRKSKLNSYLKRLDTLCDEVIYYEEMLKEHGLEKEILPRVDTSLKEIKNSYGSGISNSGGGSAEGGRLSVSDMILLDMVLDDD